MNKMIFVTISAAVLLLAAEVNAQGMGGGQGGQRPDFATLDTDSDGMLSTEELGAMGNGDQPDIATNILGRMDTDSDGSLSEEEFNTRPARGEGGQRPGG